MYNNVTPEKIKIIATIKGYVTQYTPFIPMFENRFNKGGQRFDNPNLRGSDTGPRPLMASSGGPMNGPMRGPMGGPMGLSMGQRPGPAPFDIPLGFGIIPGASAGPDPTGSYGGFFASSKVRH